MTERDYYREALLWIATGRVAAPAVTVAFAQHALWQRPLAIAPGVLKGEK